MSLFESKTFILYLCQLVFSEILNSKTKKKTLSVVQFIWDFFLFVQWRPYVSYSNSFCFFQIICDWIFQDFAEKKMLIMSRIIEQACLFEEKFYWFVLCCVYLEQKTFFNMFYFQPSAWRRISLINPKRAVTIHRIHANVGFY